MSATYTVHLPPDVSAGDVEALDRTILVRDGFSPGAFVAPMLYFFFHRHVWAGLGALLVVAALAGGLAAAGARPGTIVAAEILLHLLFGLEAPSLRRFLLARRGRPVSDLVVAPDAGVAARTAFARWLDGSRTEFEPRARTAAPVATGAARGAGAMPIIGLFPEGERHR